MASTVTVARPTMSGALRASARTSVLTEADHSSDDSLRATSGDLSLMKPLARERSKLFDREAERYDRYRPTYPAALIDDLLGPKPEGLDVLDVGCGTGIASRLMVQRGAKVLGSKSLREWRRSLAATGST